MARKAHKLAVMEEEMITKTSRDLLDQLPGKEEGPLLNLLFHNIKKRWKNSKGKFLEVEEARAHQIKVWEWDKLQAITNHQIFEWWSLLNLCHQSQKTLNHRYPMRKWNLVLLNQKTNYKLIKASKRK
jgi:hypothetical protein